jgi:poly-gamma-glutamate synthesis protein (capsule biosynthesis protein)
LPAFAARGAGDEDDQEVSVTLFDADGNDIKTARPARREDGSQDRGVEDSSATALADRAAPVYESDGSIVLKLTFTGDFTIGENVQYSGQSLFDKELAKHDGDANFIFQNYKDILENDDWTVMNFEGTLTTAGRNPDKLENSTLPRRSAYAAILPANGCGLRVAGNNHVAGHGRGGAGRNQQTLLTAGVSYYCESEPLVFTLHGVKMGMLAYYDLKSEHERSSTTCRRM